MKTLFVRGLPNDIREREIHNLFRFFFGYEGCILNENPSKQPVAFVSFTEREFASRAMQYLRDVRFDLTSTQTLHIDFAKSNSKTKRLSPHDLFPAGRRIAPIVNSTPYYPPYAQYNTPNYPMNPPSSLISNPWYRQNMNMRDGPGLLTPSYGSSQYSIPPSSKMAPCSTLFVANIHPDVPERDLVRLFRITEGFQRLKMSQKDGAPICFVEYSDISCSTNSMNSFQGFMVGPSPIRIEYAKARMGESRRQHLHQQRENYTEENQNMVYADVHAHAPTSQHIPLDDNDDTDGNNDYDSLGSDRVGPSSKRHFSQE